MASKKIRFFLFIIITILGVVLLARQWGTYQNIPEGYEWNAADAFLAERMASDDLLLFEPAWLAGYAKDYGRLKLFSVVTAREIFEKRYPPSSRLWLISMFENPSIAAKLRGAGFEEAESHSVYTVRLKLFQIPQEGVAYHFTERLADAVVSIDYGDGNIQLAEWKNGAWVFNDDPAEWNQISLRSQTFRSQTRRRCIWFHPIESGLKRISYSEVPKGGKLHIFGGIVDSGVRTPPGEPVFLSIESGGISLKTLEFSDTDNSFYHTVDLSQFPAAMGGGVNFTVGTKEQNARHFCFSAWLES